MNHKRQLGMTIAVISASMTTPGHKSLIVFATYPHFRAYYREFIEMYTRRGAEWRSATKELRFPNGSVVRFDVVDQHIAPRHYGQLLDWFELDEEIDPDLHRLLAEMLTVLRRKETH